MFLAPMLCQSCGAEFDHTNILKLKLTDEFGESVRLVCPQCKQPGPVFKQAQDYSVRFNLEGDE